MAHRDDPALSALFPLVVLAAGLNICCASSTSAPSEITTSGIASSVDPPTTTIINTLRSTVTTAATSATVSLETALGFTNTTPEAETLTPTPVSGTLTTHYATSPWSSSGLQTTGNTLASGASVASPTTDIETPSQTPLITSPQVLSEPSTTITTSNMTDMNTTQVAQSSGTETSAVTMTASEKLPTTEATSKPLAISPAPEEKSTLPQNPSASKATPEASHTEGTTFSTGVTMQEVERGLSPGSIAAITISVIAVVLLVFGLAAFLKIRHSSYGRLFDDHDYGSWGNYNNPLYDDS
ncbi:hypothetical protein JRQ81_004633 [Phrynocephalus forsythii]|uniref:Prostate androgen-regulated mucin-like protein 1 n=1 Tax=Phrynocephalus forsythii TaxID=171643 RepID=A0A9Q0XHN7_9SAUR|nr:hypothetical protein JRQ81_004633 [Phrynocephalus forsythii]